MAKAFALDVRTNWDEKWRVTMGEASFLELINATPYDWQMVAGSNHVSGCQWTADQATKIPSGGLAEIYAEFDDGTPTSAAADVYYSILSGESGGPTFFVQLRAGDGATWDPRLQIHFYDFQTPCNPQGSTLNLGWHNGWEPPISNKSGPCTFIVSGQVTEWQNGVAYGLRSNYPDAYFAHPPGASWMQDNVGSWGGRTLRRLCMPGSHDSGMSGALDCIVPIGAHQTQTQTLSIFGQLMSGCRYFDIRPYRDYRGVNSNGLFTTGHWLGSFGCNGQTLQDIMIDINNFTSKYPELIILDLGAGTEIFPIVGSPLPGSRPFFPYSWDCPLQELLGINGLYVNLDQSLDLSKLTLNDYIGGGKAAVVVLLQDNNVNLGPLAGQGFYNRDKQLPISFSYSDTDQLETMIPDQIRKMQQMRPSPDSQMFGLDWTLTQTIADGALGPSILALADWANPWIGKWLWPSITNQCFPNILCNDDVHEWTPTPSSTFLTPSFTTSLAIAINSLKVPTD